jgi:Ca2+-binding EF-hand superfamily protein
MKSTTLLIVALCLIPAPISAAQTRDRGNTGMRFQSMDANGDGVITRDEWRGNDRSFRNHDWNGDGKLSGDEVRPGAQRPARWDDRDVEDSIARDDDWTEARFASLDHDHDGRLSGKEWHGDPEMFGRLDRNRDGTVSRAEFLGSADGNADDDREERFYDLDTNRDGRLTRDEWHGSPAVFKALDANNDDVLTRAEAVGGGSTIGDEFGSVDVNGDNAISRDEWHWNAAAFDRLDTNHDGRLSRPEFDTPPAIDLARQSAAYKAGYERGHQEGIQAGKEDKPRHWDLEGQRELETADSGYDQRVGRYEEYQAGYRAGFRLGYHEGFGPRQATAR